MSEDTQEVNEIGPQEATDKASEDLMDILHGLTANTLIAKLKTGKASAQEINAAIKFLKDNNIQAEPSASKVLQELQREAKSAAANIPVTALPFPTSNQG